MDTRDWIQLPEAVLRPDACRVVAEASGLPSDALEGLRRRELYREPLGDRGLFMWPWYREQDDELRAACAEHASKLGARLPAFLDEPYESAFYLRHTGLTAFLELASEHGVDRSALEIDRVAVVEPPELDAVFEGGLRGAHPILQRLERLQELIAAMEADWADENHIARLRPAITDAVSAYIAAIEGQDTAPPPSVLEITAADFEDYEESPERLVGRCWFSNNDIVLRVGDWLVGVADGATTFTHWCPATPLFVGAGVAIVEWHELHALDLESGDWLVGELDPTEVFGGRLIAPGDRGLSDVLVISPDARYGWHGEGNLIRLGDGLFISDYEPFGDEWDPPRGLPSVASSADVAVAGHVTTVIDGVGFTHRPARRFAVDDEPGHAIVLRENRWRAFVRGVLHDGEPVAVLGVAGHHAAFSPDGDRLCVVGESHLIEIEWDEEPRLARITPLDELLANVGGGHA